MCKLFFLLSFVLNVVLFVTAILFYESNGLNVQEASRIDMIRLEDTRILETLLRGRIDKTEIMATLKANFSDNIYFDKPSENGVGAGSMFFVFDSEGKLSAIETSHFSGP